MWRIGIDEAGYGPNLGPFVMSAAACRVPNADAETDLWQLLAPAVCRKRSRGVRVDDSKKLFLSGLAALEQSVLGMLDGGQAIRPGTLHQLLNHLGCGEDLLDETWYRGETALTHNPNDEPRRDVVRRRCEETGVEWRVIRSRIIGASRFNRVIDCHGSKGAVLGECLLDLLRTCLEAEPRENVVAVVDKHGGRNYYGPLLQELSPDCWVVPIVEGSDRSSYEVRLGNRSMRVTFRPEADATSFEVALASMVSKMVRERCMEEFNAFWRKQVPNLKPTAGYPADASRFLRAIMPAIERLQLPLDSVWRKR